MMKGTHRDGVPTTGRGWIFEGRQVHYFRPFGGRKILYIWEAVEVDMQRASALQAPALPMTARG